MKTKVSIDEQRKYLPGASTPPAVATTIRHSICLDQTTTKEATASLSITAVGGSSSAVLDDLPEFCITAEEDKVMA